MDKAVSKNKKNVFLQILKYFGIVVGVFAVLLAGIYCYLRFAVGIDVFGLKDKLNLLNKPVDETQIIDNPFEKTDAVIALNKMFGENNIYQEIDDEFVFDKDEYLASSLVGDAELSDKEYGAIFDLFAKNFYVGEDNNFNDYFSLQQVSFLNLSSEGDISSVDVKVVAKIDFSSIKKSLSSGIGLSFLSNMLPNSIYFTNIFNLSVDRNGDGSFVIGAKELLINQLSQVESDEIVNFFGNFFGDNIFSEDGITELFSQYLFSSHDDTLLSSVGGFKNFIFSSFDEKILIVLKKA